MNAQVLMSTYLLIGVSCGIVLFHYGKSKKLGSMAVVAWPIIPLLFITIFFQALYEVIKEEIKYKRSSK